MMNIISRLPIIFHDIAFFIVPRPIKEKQRDLVFASPSFHPSVHPSYPPSVHPPIEVVTL